MRVRLHGRTPVVRSGRVSTATELVDALSPLAAAGNEVAQAAIDHIVTAAQPAAAAAEVVGDVVEVARRLQAALEPLRAVYDRLVDDGLRRAEEHANRT